MAKVIELQTMVAYKESLTPNGRKIHELIRRGDRYLDILAEVNHELSTAYKTDTEGKVYNGYSSAPLAMLYPFNAIGGNNSRLYYNDAAFQRVCLFYDKLKTRMIDKVLRPLWSEYDVEILMRVLYDIRGWQVTQDDYLQAIRKFEGGLVRYVPCSSTVRRFLRTYQQTCLARSFDGCPDFTTIRTTNTREVHLCFV